MNIYRNINEVPYDANTVITVGTFDGVHLGHKAIISRLNQLAKEQNARSFIVTLDPHPRIVLAKDDSRKTEIKLLNNLQDRLELFEQYGIDNVLVIEFTIEFAKTNSIDFIENLIHKQIGFSQFLIGYDHSFGKNREGDINLLNTLKDRLNFEVEQVEPFLIDDITISSTKIRKAITDNDIQCANKMLGYSYYIKGLVMEGDKRGRTIGFPTANIEVNDQYRQIPGNGVYTVQIDILDDNLDNNSKPNSYYGMANIGYRPTFHNDQKLSIEVNIFDFNQDIYSKVVKVHFLHFLRPEQKFNGIEAIISQLNKDKENSLEFLKNNI